MLRPLHGHVTLRGQGHASWAEETRPSCRRSRCPAIPLWMLAARGPMPGNVSGQSLSRVRSGPGLGGSRQHSPPRLHCQAPASQQLPACCLQQPVPSAWQEAAAGAAPREKLCWPQSPLCPSHGSAALLKAGL